MRPVYFIADLHLRSEEPKITKAFKEFCGKIRQHKPYLYIMGDLFDAWLGDDMMSKQELEVADAIASIHEAGGKTFFQSGNRDFLIGEDFLARSHCQLLSEETVIEHNEVRIFITHGDSLCSADKDLQQLRALTREPAWIKKFLAQSKEQRLALKEQYFAQSKTHIKKTDPALLRIPKAKLKEKMVEHHCDILIHGHTHKPKETSVSIDHQAKTVITLGDWVRKGWFARQTEEGIRLESFPIK